MRKYFWLVGVVALLGGCAVGLEKLGSGNEKPVVQATDGVTNDNSGSNVLQYCIDLVDNQPGDVAFVKSHGWKIVCSQSGDPELDATGGLETLGYADFEKKIIFLDANYVDETVIIHEAAHALDDIAFDVLIREKFAMDLGENYWDDAESYWQAPAEMFAESRAGCLGYEVDPEFEVMSCEMIDELIAKSDFAVEITTKVGGFD